MSSKCAQCGKTVYHGEKQSYDGQDFHGLCLQTFKKAHSGAKVSGTAVGFSSYPNKPADVSTGGAKGFCGQCGTKADGAFCGNCGSKI